MRRGDSDVGAMIGLVLSGKSEGKTDYRVTIDWQCTGVRLCLCPKAGLRLCPRLVHLCQSLRL